MKVRVREQKVPEASPAITSMGSISQSFGAKGSRAEVITKISAAGSRILRGPYKDVRENDEDAAEHRCHVQSGWDPGGLVEPQTEGTAEVRQAHSDQTCVQRGNSRAEEYSGNSYAWVGSALRCGVGV